MPLPNCIVIGAMRSGTSTCYGLLDQHPDIFMSTPKEPNYFVFAGQDEYPLVEASDSVTDRAQYERLFEDGAGMKILGEASHNYLYYAETAAPRIAAEVPDAKLIAILRNPVDRAFSHYLLHVRNEKETAPTFRDALDLEDERVARGTQFGHYVRRGRYVGQLQRFLTHFGAEQLRIYLYEDLASDAAAFARDCYRFLGVDAAYTPDTAVRANPSGIPKNRALHALLVQDNLVKRIAQPLLPRRLYRAATRLRDRNLSHPELDPDVRHELIEVFRQEIIDLQDLVDRDLTSWLR